jgi:uncharacterized protein YwqG
MHSKTSGGAMIFSFFDKLRKRREKSEAKEQHKREVAEAVQRRDVERLLELYSLQKYSQQLRDLSRPSVRLHSAPGVVQLGASKIGGVPHLPSGIDWPLLPNGQPMSFLTQLNMAQLKPIGDFVQPSTGMLYFFYDAKDQPWGFDPKDRGQWAVLHHPAADLAKVDFPTNMDSDARFEESLLTPEFEQSLPDSMTQSIDDLIKDDEESYMYAELVGELYFGGSMHRYLGHPNIVQNEMELECQLASNGIYTGDGKAYESEAARRLESEAYKWRLLMQIDSDENSGMMWGDAGLLYFWIEEKALKNEDFSNVWLVLQCY